MPKVSIIVPVYKVEKYLHRCVDSILAQAFTDWELLLIDDGSPDSSGEICDEYASKDTRIKVFHKENGGVSSARNTGLDVANGEWIVFADSDDWCENNYLSDFFEIEDLQETDVVLQGRKNEVNGEVVSILKLKQNTYLNVAKAMLENELLTFGAPYCKLYSSKLIQQHGIRFPEAYSYGEDTTFFFEVLSVSKRVITTSNCNYHYVDAEEGSLSKKDHDFEPIKQFLIDSMQLIKTIDKKSESNGSLRKAYFPNYEKLILRSIVNMYRLGYTSKQKTDCFRNVRKQLLNDVDGNWDLIVFLLKYIPIFILKLLFKLITKTRK